MNSIGSNVDGSKLVLSMLSTVGPGLAGATILPGGSSEQMQAGIGSAGITFFFLKQDAEHQVQCVIPLIIASSCPYGSPETVAHH